MARFFKFTLNLCLIYLTTAMVIMPTPCIAAAMEAMTLCVQVVIPSLFPFFVCSRYLAEQGIANLLSRYLSRWMRPLFGVPGGGALAVVLGIVSGYPIGAATVVNLYETGTCTKTEAERLLTFCNNSGPLFVLGAVGIGMLHNQKIGILLYLIHGVSALLTGFLFRKYGKNAMTIATLPPSNAPRSNPASAFATAVSDGVSAILKVCGFVILFSVFCKVLPWQSPWLYVLLEITGGVHAIVEESLSMEVLLPVLSFFLALSGLSVLLQTAGIVLPAGLSLRPYLLGKLVQAGIAFALTVFLCKGLPISQPAFSGTVPTPPLPTISQLFALTLAEILVALTVAGLFCLTGLIVTRFQRKK
ncbi:MAG: hypothetical protein J6A56_00440 [Clostridia bacterium]|nr:hypothetical protein [Clostridia bacterium]